MGERIKGRAAADETGEVLGADHTVPGDLDKDPHLAN